MALPPRLQAIVNDVRGMQVQPNPADEEEIVQPDAGWLLQLELLREGAHAEFDEVDLMDALEHLGVAEDERGSWFEDFASYI